MSVINEIVEVLEDKGYSIFESLDLLSDFDKEDLEDYAFQNLICPKCFSKLVIHSWKEPRGEHFGFPASEEMSEYYCEGCGRVY